MTCPLYNDPSFLNTGSIKCIVLRRTVSKTRVACNAIKFKGVLLEVVVMRVAEN